MLLEVVALLVEELKGVVAFVFGLLELVLELFDCLFEGFYFVRARRLGLEKQKKKKLAIGKINFKLTKIRIKTERIQVLFNF